MAFYPTNFPMLLRVLSLIFFILLFNIAASAQKSPVTAENAELIQISDDFSFTEGPATDADGNVFFTDQPNNKIWKYSVDGNLTLFMDNAGRSNGMYFDQSGNLLTCADEKGELWSISPEKEVTVLVKDFKGKRLNGPNDLWIDPDGGVYFTDPYYQRDYWERTEKEIEEERVYYLSPDRQSVFIVADDLVKPNGLIGTPDGKTLYVADSGGRKTYSYTVNTDGSLSGKALFTEMGSDGMTLDNHGNVYLTGRGVTVFNDSGTQIDHIPVPQGWTANVTFGGPDKQMLFITAGTSVFKLDMKVKGS
ncbi:MAG: SMP-30/gluconolactonase/LRE family protein [Balneolaceae bacterium]